MGFNFNRKFDNFELVAALSQLPEAIQEKIFDTRNRKLYSTPEQGLAIYIMQHAETGLAAPLAIQDFLRNNDMLDLITIIGAGVALTEADDYEARELLAVFLEDTTTSLTFEDALEHARSSPEALQKIRNTILELNVGAIVRIVKEELEFRLDPDAPEDYARPIDSESVEIFKELAINNLPDAIERAAHWINCHDDPNYLAEILDREPKGLPAGAFERLDNARKEALAERIAREGAEKGRGIKEILADGPKKPSDRGDANSKGLGRQGDGD